MKLYILGDTHGNKDEVLSSYYLAEKKECQVVVQVGDFGYWEHTAPGKRFLDECSSAATQSNIPMYWIDGNHENHTMLRELYGPGGEKHESTEEGFWKIRENLYYIPRGTKWVWDGVTFMGVGGAYSIDKDFRLHEERHILKQLEERWNADIHWMMTDNQKNTRKLLKSGGHVSWWPEETVSQEELAYVKSQGTADILFTHDAPANLDLRGLRPDPDSADHRDVMTEVGLSVQPKLWYHGHYHREYAYDFQHRGGVAKVFGLDCDGASHNYAIIDTEKAG